MDDSFTAVVTGGNRGIGYAVAAELVRRDCRIVLVARGRERGERASAALGSSVGLVVGDLSALSEVRWVADELTERHKQIDVLVHNAGVWPARLVRTPDGPGRPDQGRPGQCRPVCQGATRRAKGKHPSVATVSRVLSGADATDTTT